DLMNVFQSCRPDVLWRQAISHGDAIAAIAYSPAADIAVERRTLAVLVPGNEASPVDKDQHWPRRVEPCSRCKDVHPLPLVRPIRDIALDVHLGRVRKGHERAQQPARG